MARGKIKRKAKLPAPIKKKKRRQGGIGVPFEAGNPWRFPKGVSPNPGGRPKLLGESYAQILSEIDPVTKKSFARLLGERAIEEAMNGRSEYHRELRQATEGDTVHTPDADKIFVTIDR